MATTTNPQPLRPKSYSRYRHFGASVWVLLLCLTIPSFMRVAGWVDIAVWVAVVPLVGVAYFFIEYFVFFKSYLRLMHDQSHWERAVEEYKIERQVLVSVWVVLAIALTAYSNGGPKTITGAWDGKPIHLRVE